MKSSTGWFRVSRKHPCEICSRTDWCGYSDDGQFACCMRIRDGALQQTKNDGYLHRLADAPRREYVKAPPPPPPIDCDPLQKMFRGNLTSQRLERLVEALGLHANALQQLDVGYAIKAEAYAFPMRDPRGAIVGFRLRNLAGRKWAITGSRQGLFFPSSQTTGPLIIVEGPTDTAALLNIGLAALGRPSNTGGRRHLADYCANIRRPVVILMDRDVPGSDAERLTRGGAQMLAEELRTGDRVFIAQPPEGVKDVRQWVNAGATRADVIAALRRSCEEWVTGSASGSRTNFKTAS